MTAKKIYEIGEIPELGTIPEEMYAWVIRDERLGVPEKLCKSKKCLYRPQVKMKFCNGDGCWN